MRKFLHQAWLGKNDLFRYVIVVALAFVGYFVGQVPMLFALMRVMQEDESIGMEELNQFMSNPDFTIFNITSNTGFLLLLFTFVSAMVVFYFAFILIHKRSFKTLITGLSKVRWSRVVYGLGFWLLLTSIFEFTFYNLEPENYTFSFQSKTFLPLLIMSLLILPIQTSFEEVFFRGYMMQGLGSIMSKPIFPLILTSLAFAAIHGSNPEVGKFGMVPMMTYYISAGLLLGIVTLIDDGLELALGIHFATNFFGAVILGYDGAAIQTNSLLKTNVLDPSVMVVAFAICAILFLLVSQLLFKWKNWSYLLSNISDQRKELTTDTQIDYSNILVDDK